MDNTFADGTRWWVADNVWETNTKFKIDQTSSTSTLSQWNTINAGTADPDVEVAVTLNSSFLPITGNVSICQRLIYGTVGIFINEPSEVAAWDRYGNHRNATGVKAGAVEAPPP